MDSNLESVAGEAQELPPAMFFCSEATSPTRRCGVTLEAEDDMRVTLEAEANPATPKHGPLDTDSLANLSATVTGTSIPRSGHATGVGNAIPTPAGIALGTCCTTVLTICKGFLDATTGLSGALGKEPLLLLSQGHVARFSTDGPSGGSTDDALLGSDNNARLGTYGASERTAADPDPAM